MILFAVGTFFIGVTIGFIARPIVDGPKLDPQPEDPHVKHTWAGELQLH